MFFHQVSNKVCALCQMNAVKLILSWLSVCMHESLFIVIIRYQSWMVRQPTFSNFLVIFKQIFMVVFQGPPQSDIHLSRNHVRWANSVIELMTQTQKQVGSVWVIHDKVDQMSVIFSCIGVHDVHTFIDCFFFCFGVVYTALSGWMQI